MRRSRSTPRCADSPRPTLVHGPWFMDPGSFSGDALEEAGGSHASADAHRDDAVFAAPAAELVEDLRRELRARAAERMAQRDRAAVDVQTIFRDAQLARAVDGLARERLVDLE